MDTVKFYQKTWFIIVTLIFFFPIGIYLMWKYGSFSKVIKIIITIALLIIALVSIVNQPNNQPVNSMTDKPEATNNSNSVTLIPGAEMTETTVLNSSQSFKSAEGFEIPSKIKRTKKTLQFLR